MEVKGRVWEGVMGDYWFDDDGVLHAISKPGPRTVEVVQENFDLVQSIIHNEPVCVIIDMTHTKPYSVRAIRHLLAEFRYAYKAIGFVARSPIGLTVSTLAKKLNPARGAPIEVFDNTPDAKRWIRKYL